MGLHKKLKYHKLLLETLSVRELEELGYTKETRSFLRQTIKRSGWKVNPFPLFS
jgi:hypothetical protein